MGFFSRYAALLAVVLAFAATTAPVVARCIAFASLTEPRSMKARRQVFWSTEEHGHDLPNGLPAEIIAVLPAVTDFFAWLRQALAGLTEQGQSALAAVLRTETRHAISVFGRPDSLVAMRLRC